MNADHNLQHPQAQTIAERHIVTAARLRVNIIAQAAQAFRVNAVIPLADILCRAVLEQTVRVVALQHVVVQDVDSDELEIYYYEKHNIYETHNICNIPIPSIVGKFAEHV